MAKKKNILLDEIDNINNIINKLTRDNTNLNVVIWGLIILVVISLISTLKTFILLAFSVVLILLFLNLKNKYSTAIKDLNKLKKKIK